MNIRNSVLADPMFEDFDAQGFRFRPDPPAAALGIVSGGRREAGLTSGFPNWLASRVENDVGLPLSIEGITP